MDVTHIQRASAFDALVAEKVRQPAAAMSAVDLVEARDRAILVFLKDGSASFEAVRHAIPEEPGWTNGQRAEACQLALRRLALKKLVVHAGDTWMLPMEKR